MNNRIVLISLYDLDSIAIRTLHSLLEKNKFDVSSIFFGETVHNVDMPVLSVSQVKSLLKLIEDVDPVLVGISVKSLFFNIASKLTNEIKKKLNIKVIWGGIHPTIMPDNCLKFSDMVCVGEGEGLILDLMNRLSRDRPIDDINNLWLNIAGKVINNNLRPLIQNLDSIPSTDFSNHKKYFIKNDGHIYNPNQVKEKYYFCLTTRGCPLNCSYCYGSVLRRIYHNKGNYLRRRGVNNVIEELVSVKKNFKNLKFIFFTDDVFTFDIDWLFDFSKKYKKNINIPFRCYCHPKMLNEKILKILKYAGVEKIKIGIQSGSEVIRHDYLKRYDTNKEIIVVAKLLKKYKVSCHYDLIVDNPLESEEDKLETLNLLLELPRPFELSTFILTNFPGTDLTKLFVDKGIIYEDDVEGSDKITSKWRPELDFSRGNDYVFWNTLYHLVKKNYIPKKFIIKLSKNYFFKNNPRPVATLMKHILKN